MLETWRRACLHVIVKHNLSVRQASRQFSANVVVRHAAGRVSSSINMEDFPCELIRYVNRNHDLHYELANSHRNFSIIAHIGEYILGVQRRRKLDNHA